MKNKICWVVRSFVLSLAFALSAAPVSDAEKHHSTAMNAASYAAADRAENGFRILFIGNSITLHGSCPSIGWTNVWGMAASAREKDFVHLVTRELERRFARKADLKVVNYADFERGFRTWDFKKTADLVAFDPDVLVFALGENVSALPTEKDRLAWCDAFKKLIGAFLEGKRTKPLAVVRGSFWPDKTKDWAMAHAASDCGIPFVKADLYDIPGMDATGCGFTHPGVQAHPGDKGMAEIAARILEGLLPEKTDFKVQVDGKPAKVVATTLSAMEYNRCFGDGGDYQRPADQTERGALVQVEATGATTWRVKVARPFKKAVVRPLSANVRPKVEGGDICFTLPKCGFYVLELDDFHNPLEIFVEPKNDFADYKKKATLTFGPGIHLTRGVALKSHDRVYLDKDAVVYGGFELNGVEDVEIRGYGTIIGTTCRRGSDYLPCVGNDGKKQRPSPLTPIRAKLSKKITIEGPVVLDACEWCVATFGCEDVEVSHLKVTGAWRYNTDGIDFCNTRNVHLHDSYLHAFDDVVVLKGYVGYKDMPVENVKVERCVCWCSWGRTLENGLETWASAWRNVVFEDCDLIHNSMGALSVHLGGPCVVSDITYRKLRLEYDASRSEAEYQRGRDKPYAKAAMKPSSGNWLAIENNKMFHPGSFYKNPLVSPDEPHGSFKKVTLEDIDITVEPGVPEPSKHVSFQGGVKLGEVVLKNVRVNGRPVTGSDAGEKKGVPPSRWTVSADAGAIAWPVESDKRLPHADKLEMGGRKVALLFDYAVSAERKLTLARRLVWPGVRIQPNNTHGSMFFDFIATNGMPRLTADGQVVDETTSRISFDGVWSSVGKTDSGLVVERRVFPSTTAPAAFERWIVTNGGKKSVVVGATVPEKHWILLGCTARHVVSAAVAPSGPTTLAPGKTAEFALAFSVRRADGERLSFDAVDEERARRARVAEIADAVRFESGDPMLDATFRFAKIRAGESIYDTDGGPMHGPGGGRYYAATWCNDEVEYAGPWFGYAGDPLALEASLNAYRHYVPFMAEDYAPIPSSVVAEGRDYWNGAGDRGDAAMWAYGATRFVLASGRRDWAEQLLPGIRWTLEYCRRKVTADGVVASNTDELEGRLPAGKANLNTSSLYYDALKRAAIVERMLGDEARAADCEARAAKLSAAIDRHFGAEFHGFKTYRYYDGCTVLRSWIGSPLCVGIFDRAAGTAAALASPYLRTRNAGLLSAEGDPSGITWDRSQLYAFRGIFAAGLGDRAWDDFVAYSRARLLGEHVPYPVEAWPEGDMRHLSAEGALYCRAVTEGLFGLEPTGFGEFRANAHLPKGWKRMALRNVRTQGRAFDVVVDESGAKIVPAK